MKNHCTCVITTRRQSLIYRFSLKKKWRQLSNEKEIARILLSQTVSYDIFKANVYIIESINQGTKVANLFFDIFLPIYESYPQSAIAN